jgi:hypothetical protein
MNTHCSYDKNEVVLFSRYKITDENVKAIISGVVYSHNSDEWIVV